MRIGFNHGARRLVVRDHEDPLTRIIMAAASRRIDTAAENCGAPLPLTKITLAEVRAVAIDIVDNLRAEILAAELTMEDMG